jgi:hypothetical protein
LNIGELFVTLGVKGQGLGTLKDVAKTIANLPVDAAAAIAGMAGISLELGKMAEEAMKMAVSFQSFTNQTGLSWQELQKWQLVAEQANVSAETVASSVNTLERNLAEIRLGRGNIAPFQMLGISPQQNAFAVIEQLRQRIKGINPATATNLISQMGMSPDMMNVLRLTDRQFDDFASHVHGINERQEKDFLRAKLAVTQLGEAFRYTMFSIISNLTEAYEKVEKFRNILIAVGVVALAAAAYFFPITASIAALILVLDDLAVYFTGGKSITGLGVQGLKKFFDDIAKTFENASWLQKFILFEDILSKIAIAAEKIGGIATGNWLPMIGDLFGPGLSMAKSEISKVFSPTTNVTVHVNGGAATLDAPGWQDVANMLKKSVESAHYQLNN